MDSLLGQLQSDELKMREPLQERCLCSGQHFIWTHASTQKNLSSREDMFVQGHIPMLPLFLQEEPKLFLLLVHNLDATERWLFLKSTALALQQSFFM